MKVTLEEMQAARIPLNMRDFCAHKLIEYHVCRKRVAPFLYRCEPELHDYKHCEEEDYVLRIMEYERERRLLERERRKKSKEEALGGIQPTATAVY